jgi:hypothetical protein
MILCDITFHKTGFLIANAMRTLNAVFSVTSLYSWEVSVDVVSLGVISSYITQTIGFKVLE